MTQTTEEKRALLQRAIDEGLVVEFNWMDESDWKLINNKLLVVASEFLVTEKETGNIDTFYLGDYEFRIAEQPVTAHDLVEAIMLLPPLYTKDEELAKVSLDHLLKARNLAATWKEQRRQLIERQRQDKC